VSDMFSIQYHHFAQASDSLSEAQPPWRAICRMDESHAGEPADFDSISTASVELPYVSTH